MQQVFEVSLPFLKREQLTKDVWSFYFDRNDVLFDFVAGQYVRMTLDMQPTDGKGNSRLFTIASSPLEKEYIMLTLAVQENSFKEALFALKPGDKVQFLGPFGVFVFNERTDQPSVFL